LWKQARVVGENDKALVPSGLFIPIAQSNDRRAGVCALRLRANRIPSIVLVMLYVLAATAGDLSALPSAMDSRLTRLPVVIMGLLISLVLY
jgi:hypothetical protein